MSVRVQATWVLTNGREIVNVPSEWDCFDDVESWYSEVACHEGGFVTTPIDGGVAVIKHEHIAAIEVRSLPADEPGRKGVSSG